MLTCISTASYVVNCSSTQAIARMLTELGGDSKSPKEEAEVETEGDQQATAAGGEEEVHPKSTSEGVKEVKVEYLPLDLASFQSTTDFVHAFKEKGLPLHILINNAALCAVPYSNTTVLDSCTLP